MSQLSDKDIFEELKKDSGLKIRLGIKDDKIIENHIHSASYDLTPSIVAMSVKKGMLETVYKNKSENTNSYYIYVKPKDTVLIVSNEYLSFPTRIAGYVTSRVSNVAYGFGHISTTVDPNWNGALLIALSNPSSHSIKVNVGITMVLGNNDNHTIYDKQNTLATLTFHYLRQESTKAEFICEYKSLRIDLLEKIKYDKRTTFVSRIRKIIYYKRRKYTDYFFDYIKTHEKNMMTSKGWSEFLDEFSKVIINSKATKKITANNYIIKENFFRRLLRFLTDYKKIIAIIAFFILFILYECEIINTNIIDFLFHFPWN